MQIYVHKNNQQIGPFTEAEVKAQLASGALTLQDHVWWQGQANWLPLGQTILATPGPAPMPTVPGAPMAPEMAAPTGPAFRHPGTTSQLAIWSLVCGCLSILCWPFTSIPAIILGHLGLSQIKKTPGLQGGGMALGGLIIGYFFTVVWIASIIVVISLGQHVGEIFKTINSQIAAQAAINSEDSTSTNTDQSPNSPDQKTPTATPTNSPTSTPGDSNTNNTPTATPTQQ